MLHLKKYPKILALKGLKVCSFSRGTYCRATERLLPYGITQRYSHPAQVNVAHLNPSQTGRYLIYLPRRDGRLSWLWCCFYTKIVYLSAVTHPSSNLLIATWPEAERTTVRSLSPVSQPLNYQAITLSTATW